MEKSTEDIIRAWKDEAFLDGLSTELKTALPGSPVGPIALTDEDLGHVSGAVPQDTAPCLCSSTCTQCTAFCPTEWLGNTCRYCTYTSSC